MSTNKPKKILLTTTNFEKVSLITAAKDRPLGLKTVDSSHYPIGLAYLHSYLEFDNHKIQTLFLNNYGDKECFDIVIKTIEEFLPEIIGFQVLTANRISAYRLIDYIHNKYPKINILIGGMHATIMHRQLLEKFPYVIAVLGEGEITFSELAKELSNPNLDLHKIDGIAFNEGGNIIRTNPRKLIENLDRLPFPKHEMFFNNNRASGCILTARGCPFNCSFCCLDVLSQRRVRLRSVENILAEIEFMIKKFPQMSDIWIHDDTFFIDNKRVVEFCDEIIKRKIKISFTCSGRMKPLNQEMVNKLEQANFKKILLGLESGDEGILKSCHKAITQQDVINAIKLFSKSKITVTAFLIVGLPGETLKTILETAKFVKKLQKIKYLYFSETAILTVYPGTEVYEIAKTGGMIDDSYWLTDKPTPLFTLENSEEQLIKFKEILLNHISVDRFFTPAGFIKQFKMTPYVIKYTYNHRSVLKNMLHKTFKTILPRKILEFLINTYKKL
ncbi:MAG: radical SAM protein [Parcubacteria group bacterium]